MRRLLLGLVVLLLVFAGLASIGTANELDCRALSLPDLFWLASFDDESGRTEGNFADVIQGSDEHGAYYGMEWSSPENTDLTIGDLDQQDLTSSVAIQLSLSAPTLVSVLPVIQVQDGDYCGRTWRYATAGTIEVGPELQDYKFSASDFSDDPFGGCPGPLEDDALKRIYSIVLFPEDREGELRIYSVEVCTEPAEEVSIEQETHATPAFAIDHDVTRDSVVQIGDGPQELSTDIKFYPNTRRAKPGDTVYWRTCTPRTVPVISRESA